MTVRALGSLTVVLAALGLAGSASAPAPATIEVTLTEGTNMAAALSPDGATLALDLVGRIWTVPARGGTAVALTDPFGDARQPAWAPGGDRIAFQAYWAGDYDVWVVNADGSGLKQLTAGPFDDREPHWSPDGARVVFSSDRGGTYDIWDVDVGTGQVRRLTDADDNEYGPAYSPDGARIAYASDGDGAGIWVAPAGRGPARRVVSLAPDEGFGPSWSRDGSRIAYNRLTYGFSELYVAPVTGAEGLGTRLSDAGEDVFPFRAQWTADGRLLYTGDGKVRSRPASGGGAVDVAFQATVTLERPAYRRAIRSLDPAGPRPVRGIVSPALSPDGGRVVFTALGDLWMLPIGGVPARLTSDPWVEVDPAWSPDGASIAFASDREGDLDVWVRSIATGAERRVTTGGGGSPAWSPDGTRIAFAGGGGPGGGIRVVDVATGATRTVRTGLNNPGRPSWSPDGGALVLSAHWRYSTRFREGVNRPLWMPVSRTVSDDSDDSDEIPSAPLQEAERWLDFVPHGSIASRGTDGPLWSPNGRMMAYVADGLLWAVTVAADGSPTGPARRLNNEFTSDPSWAGDSRSILYLTTDRLRRVWLEDGRIEDVPLTLTWERVVPSGRTVVHAGALFDGVRDGLRRDVDVVVDGHRIVRVADHDPALHGADPGRVVDASDHVVTPGLIDIHSHFGLGSGEQLGRQWLAFGVTTTRQPSSDPFEMVEAREAEAVHRRIGPRIFGSGPSVDGSRIYYGGSSALTSTGQAELQMRQLAALEADLLKTYVRLPDAVQRRLIEDAHAMGVPVTSHELYPAVAVGVDGVEHVRGTSRRGYSTKVTQLNRSYQDVVELLARSGMTITPTVGIYGSFAVIAETDPTLLDDPRVRAFLPGVEGRARRGGDLEVRRRMLADMASLGRRVVERGGTVVVGTDSPQDKGLTLLAEMEALVELGGMRPVDVMRATTSVAAEALGYGSELGSVREGMLADLIVIDGNPLEDIRAVRSVRTVVKDGRVYDVAELLERPAG